MKKITLIIVVTLVVSVTAMAIITGGFSILEYLGYTNEQHGLAAKLSIVTETKEIYPRDSEMKTWLIDNTKGVGNYHGAYRPNFCISQLYLEVTGQPIERSSDPYEVTNAYLEKYLTYDSEIDKWVFIGRNPPPLFNGGNFYVITEFAKK